MHNSNNDTHNTPQQHGLVISYFGSSVAVEADDGQVFQCHLRRNQELPVVGDRVLWTLEADKTGLVAAILPRQTLLARCDAKGKKKPIAANVDVMVIVMGPPPIFSDYLVDRYMVAAELLGIQPVLVMNKADLLNEDTGAAALACLAVYRDIPCPVVLSSIVSDAGLAELMTLLKGKTAVLVGPSGVGKSSIIAVLGKDDAIRIGEVSPRGAGKHTTTATRLYHLPQGGYLIDSPGVREFNLWSVGVQDVFKGFRELKEYLSGCRFRDCSHAIEPGCAVQSAVASGKISPQRYANFQALLKEARINEKNANNNKY